MDNQTIRVYYCYYGNVFTQKLESVFDHLKQANISSSPEEDGHFIALLFVDSQLEPKDVEEKINYLKAKNFRILLINLETTKHRFYHVWQFLSMSVDEYLQLTTMEELCQSIIARIKRWQEVENYVHNDQIQRLLVGQSPAWHKLLRNVVELALFTNGPILIQGESGTGKELIAQIIHQVDQRKDKQSLVLVDCTTLQATLSGSELFGHERGAFTDASNSREGAVSLADKGSLFLDELGELPLNIQAQFLRLLQEGTYKKVGSNQWKRSKFRLISATNRDLETEVDKGTFRMDLYYRVCANIIKVPNLKSRIEDIPVLVRHFISSALKMAKMPHIDSYLMNYLMTRTYKGNIRELKHLCEQLAHRYPGEGPISLAHLPSTEFQTNQEQKHFWERIGFINCLRQAIADGIGLKDIKRIAANVAMDLAIKDSDGNLQQAAQVLEISDRKLQAYQASKRKEEPPSNVA